jgi:hypothetical protein
MAIGSLLSLIPTLLQQFRGVQETPAEKQQRGLSQEIANLARARMDPNDPRYLALYNQERQSGQQDLARVIAEAQGQNRMATRLGRTPLFDPGRGGETQFRSLMQSYGGVQDNARQRARGIMGEGQAGLGQAYSAAQGLATQQDLRQRRNLAMELGGYDTIGRFMGGGQGGGNTYGAAGYGSGGSTLMDALMNQYKKPSYMQGVM